MILSKFDRYKKNGESYYIYPHKHCQKCGQMIEESMTYCTECYNKIQERKKTKKRFDFFKKFNFFKRRKEIKDTPNEEKEENTEEGKT